jgi:hypothetical protein
MQLKPAAGRARTQAVSCHLQNLQPGVARAQRARNLAAPRLGQAAAGEGEALEELPGGALGVQQLVGGFFLRGKGLIVLQRVSRGKAGLGKLESRQRQERWLPFLWELRTTTNSKQPPAHVCDELRASKPQRVVSKVQIAQV